MIDQDMHDDWRTPAHEELARAAERAAQDARYGLQGHAADADVPLQGVAYEPATQTWQVWWCTPTAGLCTWRRTEAEARAVLAQVTASVREEAVTP